MRLDNSAGERIIGITGGEDRALLRSNPSARTDAGITAEGDSMRCFPPPVLGKDPGHKAANLGVWGGAPIQEMVLLPRGRVTYVKIIGRQCGQRDLVLWTADFTDFFAAAIPPDELLLALLPDLSEVY